MAYLIPVAKFVGAIFVGAGAGASVAYVAAVNVARVAVLSLAARRSSHKPALPQVTSEKLFTNRGSVEHERFGFGTDMTSGPLIYANTAGNERRDLYNWIYLAGHEIESFEAYRVDDYDIEIGVDIASDTGVFNGGRFDGTGEIDNQPGTSTQVVPAALASAFTEIDSSHRCRGWATVLFKWQLVEGKEDTYENGAPQNMRALVKLAKVYDPRLDNNQPGGSGSHLENDSTTWEYSVCPALCLAHFMRDSKFGTGESGTRINWVRVITAADICDATVSVPGGTEARYTVNALFDSSMARRDVRDILVDAMLGRIVLSGGVWEMWAGAVVTADVTLTEKNLAGGVDVQLGAPAAQRYNRARGKFVDPTRDYTANAYSEIRSTTYLTEDNNRVHYLPADWPAAKTNYGAQRLSIMSLKISRNMRVMVWEGNLSCFLVQPGAVVDIDLAELGFTGEKFFVTESVTSFADGKCTLTLVEENDAAWTDPLSGEYSTRTASGSVVFGNIGVPAPTGAALSSARGGIHLTWTNPPSSMFTSVEVWASDDNVRGNAELIATVETNSYFDQVSDARNRFYWLRCRNEIGSVSDWLPDLTTTTLTKSAIDFAADILDSRDWVTPIADPMGKWANYADGIEANALIYKNVQGPFDDYPLTLQLRGDGVDYTPNQWYSAKKVDFSYDADKGYVIYSYFSVYSLDTEHGVYMSAEHGANPNEVVKVAGGAAVAAPYYISNVGRAERGIRPLQWYLAVCKIHPSGFGGTNEQTAGIYHVPTGAHISASDEYEWNGQQNADSLAFWGLWESRQHTAADGFYITKPVGYVIDGKEPSIGDMLQIETAVNLVNSAKWTIPIQLRMGRVWWGTGASLDNASVRSDIAGPFGEYPLVLEINGDGLTAPGSYWEQFCSFRFQASKSYIVYVWFEVLDGTLGTPNGVYLGIEAAQTLARVNNADTLTADLNPYFVSNVGLGTTDIDADQWYLGVAVIHPDNYVDSGGIDEKISGVYDPRSGLQIVAADHDFEWATAVDGETHFRALLFKSPAPVLGTDDGFRICRTAVFERDGTEPSINSYLTSGGIVGDVKDVKFKRDNAAQTTPTGDNPAGWTDYIPEGTETIWQITGTKTAFGILTGVWSVPARISGLTNRGAYLAGSTYLSGDVVTYAERSYICTATTTTGNAPSGSNAGNAWWDILAGKGDSGAAAVDWGPHTIAITGTDPVNLRELADNYTTPYDGLGDVDVTFTIASGITITGFGGGGHGIDSGDWPAAALVTDGITVENEGIVRAGGGNGGAGGSGTGNGANGGQGGDAFFCRVNMTIDNAPSASGTIEAAGGGGGGGDGYEQFIAQESFSRGGGGGGGGEPNGGGGAKGADEGAGEPTAGAAGTTSGGGAGGTGISLAGDGGDGGDSATAGDAGISGGSGGATGYAVRKNGNTVTATGGTITGTVG
jgi:hypothetical protein